MGLQNPHLLRWKSPCMFCVSLCELTEGICRCLLSILMTTVSADNLDASGEAGWGGEGGMGLSEPLWCLLVQRPCSWEWSLAGP